MNKDCDVVKMSKCFWCGGDKNELIMSTRMDSKWCSNKNKSVVINYEPCDKCKKEFDKGVHIIEIAETPFIDKQPEIQKGVYPSGNMWVIANNIAKDIFSTDSKKILITKEIAKKVGLYGAAEDGK